LATIKDTEYLYISTRVRALESRLLTHDRMIRMLEASTNDDATRVLLECGYPDMVPLDVYTIQETLAAEQRKAFEDLANFVPAPAIIDVFKVKYDYHNVKVLLKAEAMKSDPTHLLLDLGRVSVRELSQRLNTSDLRGIPAILQAAITQARETLATTKDPQLSDFVLDHAYYQDMRLLAEEAESSFLEGYVRICIDAANLRTAVRTIRMGKNAEFLQDILFPGGNISTTRVLAAAADGASLGDLFAVSPLSEAAEAGVVALAGGRLTQFEKLCDNAVTNYLQSAKHVSFGEAPVIAYLAAKENELTAIRIILTGRLAALPADIIQERLRESYV